MTSFKVSKNNFFSKWNIFIGDLNFGPKNGLQLTLLTPHILTANFFCYFGIEFGQHLIRLIFLLGPPTPILIFKIHFAL